MLNLNQVIQEYPASLQKYKQFLYKEYLQYKILNLIFKNKYGRQLSFLGGTALRIVHNNNRFSEDLDFDNFNLSVDVFEQLFDDVKNNLEKQGFNIEIRNVFKGAYHCYLKFPRLLYQLGLTPHQDEKILIQIDTAPHNFQYQPDNFLLNKFDVFREIRVTPLDIILSQKIYAALERKRDKGRDYYDIVFLLSKTEPNFDYLKLKTGISNKDELKKTLLEKCQSLNFVNLTRDVSPFIFEENGEERVLKFKEVINSL